NLTMRNKTKNMSPLFKLISYEREILQEDIEQVTMTHHETKEVDEETFKTEELEFLKPSQEENVDEEAIKPQEGFKSDFVFGFVGIQEFEPMNEFIDEGEFEDKHEEQAHERTYDQIMQSEGIEETIESQNFVSDSEPECVVTGNEDEEMIWKQIMEEFDCLDLIGGEEDVKTDEIELMEILKQGNEEERQDEAKKEEATSELESYLRLLYNNADKVKAIQCNYEREHEEVDMKIEPLQLVNYEDLKNEGILKNWKTRKKKFTFYLRRSSNFSL
ncbi:hypothetical protein KI387_010367, partial [Taxus chinensis]